MKNKLKDESENNMLNLTNAGLQDVTFLEYRILQLS